MSANKVTYVSLSADDPAIDAGFTAAIAEARASLGALAPLRVAGATRPGVDGAAIESRNPADTRVVVARVATGGAEDLRDAVAAARAAFPAWSGRSWQERVAIIDRAAEIVRARKFELSVAMILEMGKNRVEALGEIEETADLLAYYAGQMRANNGYVHEMDRLAPTDQNLFGALIRLVISVTTFTFEDSTKPCIVLPKPAVPGLPVSGWPLADVSW